VGCVTSQIAPELGIGRIPDLMVDASYRGQGIGRRLLEHVLAHFRSLGLVAARIETLAHNKVGMHLYPSLGFELIATQHHYAMLLAPPATEEGPPGGTGG
jgi:ribosomal protein S18 acetylase RimI-like enzyme